MVIVNRTFVQRYLPDRDPLGVRVRFTPVGGDEERWHTIVGVAPDLFMDGPQNASPDGMYLLEALLFNVAPGDPITFIGIAATLLATGIAAITVGARRAARTDPLIALRRH